MSSATVNFGFAPITAFGDLAENFDDTPAIGVILGLAICLPPFGL
jgi:hypothetical protein